MRADGWSDAKLRELVVAGGLQTGPFGGQLHADEYVADGVPVVMPQDIISGEISTEHIARVSEEKAASLAQHRLRTGDLVFARRGDIGRVGMARDRENGWLCGTGCLRARPSERVSPVYLHYAVRRASSIAWLNIHAVGQTMLNLNTSILGQLPADVPPLPEQRAIAAVLDSLDDAIQKTEQIIAKLQQVKQGLLHDLLTRGIDDNGELRDPDRHPEQFQDSPLGRIPKGWRIVQLQALLEHVIDYRGRTPLKLGMRWGSGEIPALSAMNVQMGRIDLSRETYFGSDALYRRWMTDGDVKRGDIIITLEAPLGNVAQVSDERRYILSQRVVLLRFRRMDISNDFAAWQMRSDPIQRQLVRWSTGTTATGIQRAKLNLIPLLVPSLTEQSSVTILLHCHEAHITAQSLELEKLRELKVGLSDDLLTGRVRTTSLPGFSA